MDHQEKKLSCILLVSQQYSAFSVILTPAQSALFLSDTSPAPHLCEKERRFEGKHDSFGSLPS